MADIRQLWFCHNQLSINCAKLSCKSNLNLKDSSMSFYCNRLSLHYIHTYMEILQNCGKISRKNVFEKKVIDKLRFTLRQLHSGFEEVTHRRAATNSSSSVFLHLTDRSCPRYIFASWLHGYFWTHVIDTRCFECTNTLPHSLWQTTNTRAFVIDIWMYKSTAV